MKIPKAIPLGLILALAAILIISPHMPADDAKPQVAADAPPVEEHAVTRIYDIRGLCMPPPDFTFENSPHAGGFVDPAIPNSNASGPYFSGGGIGGGGGGGGNIRQTNPTRAELVEPVVKLITDTIAPDTWRDYGGTLGSVREMNGLLIVSQTAANHKRIADLLRDVQSRRDETVRTDADWLILPRAQIAQLLKANPAGGANIETLPVIDLPAVDRLPANVRRYHAELVCINGQTVNFVSGRERSVTVTQTAIVGTDVSAYQPFVANVGGGIALQISPVLYREQKNAVVTLLSTFTDPDKSGKPIGLRAYATTQASSGEIVMASEATATYRPLNGIVQELRTTARVPLGIPVLVGAMSLEPTAKDGQDLQLLLILTVRAADGI